MRLIVADLRMLLRRPATWLSLGVMQVLLLLIFVAIGATTSKDGTSPRDVASLALVTFPGAYTLVLAFVLGIGGLFAVIYGANVAGTEWTWGTMKDAVARGEGRAKYILSLFGATAVLLVAGFILAFALGVVIAAISGALIGLSTRGLFDIVTVGHLPEQLLRGSIAMVATGALGYAIATVARSQLAGIGIGIAFYFAESFAALIVPEVTKWLPFHATQGVIAGGGRAFAGSGGPAPVLLDPNLALVMVAFWLVVSMGVAALVTERADIPG